ncbi:1718_t:CDS:2, partial [Funneliformis geosporum]
SHQLLTSFMVTTFADCQRIYADCQLTSSPSRVIGHQKSNTTHLTMILQSNNDPTDFFSRVDDFYRSLRNIQCNQAKSIIFQAQE